MSSISSTSSSTVLVPTPRCYTHDPYAWQPVAASIASSQRASTASTVMTPPQSSRSSSNGEAEAPTPDTVAAAEQGRVIAPSFPQTLFHRSALQDRCELLVPPRQETKAIVPSLYDPSLAATAASLISLFIGHLRFETTAGEIRWLILQAAGVEVVACDARPGGCFLVHLKNDNDARRVRSLHKRLLLDVDGVWFASTPASVNVMADYIRDVLAPLRSRRERATVPHDALCVELPKSPMRPPPLHASAIRSMQAASSGYPSGPNTPSPSSYSQSPYSCLSSQAVPYSPSMPPPYRGGSASFALPPPYTGAPRPAWA